MVDIMKKTILKKILKSVYIISIFPFVVHSSDTVTVNITGQITASTCDLETPTVTFDYGDLIYDPVSKSLSSTGWGERVPVTLNCPSGLEVTVQLDGNQATSTNSAGETVGTSADIPFWIRASTDDTDQTFVFELARATTSSGDLLSIRYNTWVNISANNVTTLGSNVFYLASKITRTNVPTVKIGKMTGTVTVKLRYQS